MILKQFPDFTPEEIALRIERCDVADFDESQLKEFLAALPTGHEVSCSHVTALLHIQLWLTTTFSLKRSKN